MKAGTQLKATTAAANLARSSVLIGIATMLMGCDAVVDCLDNDGPVFRTTSLAPATLNQVYQETIRAAVNNEPFDDRFEYDFTIINGALPPGISTTQAGRSYIFTGTPTELGTFNIEINVFVDDGQDAVDSGLCFRNRSREFSLIVAQDAS